MLDESFKTFEPWAEKVEAEEAEQFRRLTKAIERETYTFYRSITAQRTRNEGRARNLDAMRQQRAAAMRDQPRELQMAVDSGEQSGRRVAEARHIAKAWGDKAVVRDFSTRILRGDRLAVVGPNGAGKTTLVRTLLGEIEPDAGTVKLGTGLQIAYLDQSRSDLNEETTLWNVLAPAGGDSLLVRGQSKHVAAYAKEFLFKDSQLRQPVRTLSGGERNRLLLGPRPGQARQPDGAGRADQRSGHGHAGPAGGPARRLRRHPGAGQPRPRLHRPAGHVHHRAGRARERRREPPAAGATSCASIRTSFAAAAPKARRAGRLRLLKPRRPRRRAVSPSCPTRTSAGWRSWTG